MKTRKRVVIVILICVLALLIAAEAVIEFFPSQPTLKEAVGRGSLNGKRYILCERDKVTGFDWHILFDSEGADNGKYCNITNCDPFSELNLTYEFETGHNTFVFYVSERKEYSSEELREDTLDFEASGWDILYPVKREPILGCLKSRKYILESDTYLSQRK